MTDATAPTLPPDDQDRRFGDWLVRLNLARRVQLEAALVEQARRRDAGVRVRLGHVLVEQGVLSADDMRQVLELQSKTLMLCPRCQEAFPVVDGRPGASVARPPCGAGLYLPDVDATARGGPAPRTDAAAMAVLRPLGAGGATPDPAGPVASPAGSGAAAAAETAGGATASPDATVRRGMPAADAVVPAPAAPAAPDSAPQTPVPVLADRPASGAAVAATQANPIADAAGTRRTIADRYLLERELGRGGMGVVYRAHDLRLNRDVALKVLLVGDRADREEIERFTREARAAAGLQHPGIVQVFDVGELGGKPYYVMELLEGRELADWILEGALGPRDAAEIVRQVAEALRFAHAHGVLHRDIKPRNIVVQRAGRPREASREDRPGGRSGGGAPDEGPGGRSAGGATEARDAWQAKLLDFGLAKFAEQEVRMPAGKTGGASLRTLTRSGELVGTPAYMSPELAVGASATADARTDVYSLGAALYEALVGEPPFHDAATLALLLLRIRNDDPAPPRLRVPDLDRDLETVCLKCLQKDPKDRYAGAGDLADDCRRWRAGEPVAARPVGRAGRLWRKARRNRGVAALVATVVLAALGAGAWFGGGELLRQERIAAQLDEGRAALAARDFDGARRAAEIGLLDAPDDERFKLLSRQAQSEKSVAAGEAAFALYRSQRDEADRLRAESERARRAAEKAKTHAEKAEAWKLAPQADAAARAAEQSFAEAVARLIEAMKLWDEHPTAEQRMAGFYFDQFERAERAHLRREMDRAEAGVRQYDRKGQEYAEALRGARRVRVEFLLPAEFAAAEVETWLYRYETNGVPPVLAPVPCDPRTGAALAQPDLRDGEPIPLKLLAGRGRAAAGLATAERADLARKAGELVNAGQYAVALSLLERLTRAGSESPEHPYHLACCLARASAQADPFGWLTAAIGEAEVSALAARAGDDPFAALWAPALAKGASAEAWKTLAFLALEESVRRGWADAGRVQADADLAALRADSRFTLLCALMSGAIPRTHVHIARVLPGSPAAQVGLRDGDVVLAVRSPAAPDGPPPAAIEEVARAIQSMPAGAAYEVVVWRGGERVTATATGGGRLGIELAALDLSPAAPTRFPPGAGAGAGGAPGPADDPVERRIAAVRWGSVYRLERTAVNRVTMPWERDPITGRRSARLDLTLPRGSYLLYVPAGEGLFETRYPFEVARDLEWDEHCELVAEGDVPPLPPGAESLAPPSSAAFWVYVPAGPYRASGDPQAQQSPPRDAAIVRVPDAGGTEGYFVSRFEVTSAMYVAFLDDLAAQAMEDPFKRVPRQAVVATAETACWTRGADGRFRLRAQLPWWLDDLPISSISWDDATAYMDWLSRRPGPRRWTFALPTEDEWERCARGVDGRSFPGGEEFDPTFARTLASREGEQEHVRPESPGLFPLDESPFGVRDVAGGMREWTATVSGSRGEWRIVKGGSFGGPSAFCRLAFRNDDVSWGVYNDNGLRFFVRRTR